MGQKVHPLGLRLGITQQHRSDWFAKSNIYPFFVFEDQFFRSYILNQYPTANIVKITISRSKILQNMETKKLIDFVQISIHTANPGKILGRSKTQTSMQELKTTLEKLCQKTRTKKGLPEIRLMLNVFKITNIYSEASVIANYLIQQLEERIPFRTALKKALKRTEPAKLKGIKIQISGRLNGAEIARTEWVRKGRVPLQTLRADIDYSYKTAKTIYGILGIKIWTLKSTARF